jgi:Toastrack DUF4097
MAVNRRTLRSVKAVGGFEMIRRFAVTATLAAALVAAGSAQTRDRRSTGDRDCYDGWSDRQASFCEVREATIGVANPIDVDASPNGGIVVRGWDRGDVLVRSKVRAHALTDAEARRLVSGVRIDTLGGRVRAEGPASTDRDENWSVSFELLAPRAAMLTLNTKNGGITIENFGGTAKFRAVNGGVTLNNVNGDVRGETVNGGLSIDLHGDHWDGTGLDVETHNGGVKLTVPSNYSAELETGTVNGGLNIDFPITVSGRISRRLTTTLGAGGPRIRAITTNGGVTVRRR